MPSSDPFVDAVKPALEALLSDLQHTTEVLRRANTTSPAAHNMDIEPIYQKQAKRMDATSRRSIGSPSLTQSFNNMHERLSPSRDLPLPDSNGGITSNDHSGKHGISTIPKGDCAQCNQPIIGQVVIALGKMWHPEHYTCFECGLELGNRNFFERNGRAYCEEDYHNHFSPRCASCNGPIKDRCVSALKKNYHVQCFTCAECGQEFGDDGFHEKDGLTYCRRDFFRLFAPRCKGCSKPIASNFITALGTQWHPECFVCQMCGTSFAGGSFFDGGGEPLCEIHYHERHGSLCHQCRAPISGRCVTAIGRKFHPEHFRCSHCSRQLTKGTFKEVDRRPLCNKCYNDTYALT